MIKMSVFRSSLSEMLWLTVTRVAFFLQAVNQSISLNVCFVSFDRNAT